MSGRGIKRKNQGPPCILQHSEQSNHSDPKQNGELPLRGVRDLGLFCLMKDPHNARGAVVKPPKLVTVHNREAVDSWLLLNIAQTDEQTLQTLDELCDLALTSVANGADHYGWCALSELCRLSNDKAVAKSNQQQVKNKIGKKDTEQKCTLESLCPTAETLKSLGFPQTGVRLNTHEGQNEGYALDCEMCLSGSTQVLTRLAVVRFSDGEVLIDQLIKPEQDISDYVTAFSGITKEMLQDVTFSLKDAQTWLQKTIGSSDYLIGHSLDSDLNVLKIQHDKIIDTTLLYPHYRGLPYRSSLKYLTKKYLDWDIQKSLENGHNPVEDAVACERLVRLILQEGPQFGDLRLQSTPLSAHLSQNSLKSTIIGPGIPEWDGNGTADHISESDPAKCVDAALKARESSQFICCTLESEKDLSDHIRRLFTELREHTLVTVLVGTGDEHALEVQRLREKKIQFKKDYRTKKWDDIEDPWTTEDDTRIKEAIARLKRGSVYFAITIDPEELRTLPTKIRDRLKSTPGKEKPGATENPNNDSV